MKNRIDSSRRKIPWNKKDETILQSFIENTYIQDYDVKHPMLLDTSECEIINSIKINECRYCSSSEIIKRGKTDDKVQLYYCKNCKKRFTPVTNTIFENHKISIKEWIEYLLYLFNYNSISQIAKINKNSVNTSKFWLKKIFLVLENWQDTTILSGNIFIDEMFYSVVKKDIVTKNGKRLRGLSKNQYCIGVGYDGNKIYAKIEGLGKPSSSKTLKTFENHIKPHSKLFHDDEKSHNDLVNKNQLIDISYKSVWLKMLNDDENPLQSINHQCDLIRQFLNAHSGFDRNDLQGYLNLYCFMNSGHKNKLDKVNEFLELALTKKTSLKYRTLYPKKEKNGLL